MIPACLGCLDSDTHDMIVVMYVVKVPNRGSPPAILLRESYREDGKVKNRRGQLVQLRPFGVSEAALAGSSAWQLRRPGRAGAPSDSGSPSRRRAAATDRDLKMSANRYAR